MSILRLSVGRGTGLGLGCFVKWDLREICFKIFFPALVLGLALLVSRTQFGADMENLTLDWRFQYRGASDPPADARLLVVGISEKGLGQWGQWPWSRMVHAKMVKLLLERHPKVIGFDLMFTEASQDSDDDAVFGDTLILHPDAITGAHADHTMRGGGMFGSDYIGNTQAITRIEGDLFQLIGHDSGILPVQILAESSYTGFVNADPAPDGVRRKLPMVVRCGRHAFPGFAMLCVMRTVGAESEDVEVVLGEVVRIKGAEETIEIPIDERGRLLINYRHQESFTFMTYFDLFVELAALSEEGKSWPHGYPPVKDQTLIIGQTAAALTDFGPTPHAAISPLMLVNANAANNILQGDYITVVPGLPVAVAWLLIAWLGLFLLRSQRAWVEGAVPILIVIGFIVAAFALFQAQSLHLPLFWPIGAFVVAHSGNLIFRLSNEFRAKARIKGMFGSYLAPEIVEEIVATGEEPALGGEESEITAFFSDIESFTGLSESIEPDQLIPLINEYLSQMTDVLYENGGTLDKYIGDAIVGMFGAPITTENHAYRACFASVQMQLLQTELATKWRREGNWPRQVSQMRTRIGLCTGPAIIGNMGSRQRFNYTMMGDTVNLASRSESGAKTYGVYVMVTGTTRDQAVAHKDDIVFRLLDKAVLFGRSQPVELYEIVGMQRDITPETEKCLDLYAEGLKLYRIQQWNSAQEFFVKASELELEKPTDTHPHRINPSLVMAARCDHFRLDPPGATWNGEFVLGSK